MEDFNPERFAELQRKKKAGAQKRKAAPGASSAAGPSRPAKKKHVPAAPIPEDPIVVPDPVPEPTTQAPAPSAPVDPSPSNIRASICFPTPGLIWKPNADGYNFPPHWSDIAPPFTGPVDLEAPFRPAWGLRNKDTVFDCNASDELLRHLPFPEDEREYNQWGNESFARWCAQATAMTASSQGHLIRRFRQATRLLDGKELRIREQDEEIQRLQTDRLDLQLEVKTGQEKVGELNRKVAPSLEKYEDCKASLVETKASLVETKAALETSNREKSELKASIPDERARAVAEFQKSEELEMHMFEYSQQAHRDGFRVAVEKMREKFPGLDLSAIVYPDDEQSEGVVQGSQLAATAEELGIYVESDHDEAPAA